MEKRVTQGLVIALCLGAAACSSEEPTVAVEQPTEQPELRASTRADLQWKRYAAVNADLMAALELEREDVCTELGQNDCVYQVHLVPLGGNDPIGGGLYVPSAEPLSTTPAAIDRILLSACGKRVELDRKAGKDDAKVFGRLALDKTAPEPSDERVLGTVADLYRRLLARDPEGEEQARVAALAVDEDGKAVTGADFATLACFAIGTTTEFLFF